MPTIQAGDFQFIGTERSANQANRASDERSSCRLAKTKSFLIGGKRGRPALRAAGHTRRLVLRDTLFSLALLADGR